MSQEAVMHGRDLYTAHAELLICWCHMCHFGFFTTSIFTKLLEVRGSNPQQGQGGLVPALFLHAPVMHQAMS